MNARLQLLLALLLAAILAGLAWLWYDRMELRWDARDRISEAAAENRMLGATLLLRQRGYKVELAGSLGALNLRTLPDGTLIVANEHGVTTPESAQLLLAWVRRGNTLLTSPRWATPAERADLAVASDDEVEDEDEDEGDDGEEDPAPASAPKAAAKPPPAAQQDPIAQRRKLPRPRALVEIDPLAARYGVRRKAAPRLRQCTKEHEKAVEGTGHVHTNCIAAKDFKPAVYRLDLPASDYALTLDEGNGAMFSMPAAAAPLWADEKAEVLRVYAEGKGRIVFMAGNYFSNTDLQGFDHAELLLAIARLAAPAPTVTIAELDQSGRSGKVAPSARTVTIVKSLDVLPWYQALWRHFPYLLIALALCVALLFWMAVRRFGPLLPQPAAERRSLMEHIATSGAWLWKAEGGRQLLLEAAREDTMALVRRRAPALVRLPSHELPAALAAASGLDREHLLQALQDDAARHPIRFTRQIRTLQELRNHYER